MIVVAIVGILSAIAIPKYETYKGKARTTEAKLYLASAFTAEKAFIVEYTSYTECLGAAGFAPLGNTRYYTVSVISDSVDDSGPGGTGSDRGANWGNGAPDCTATGGEGTTSFAANTVSPVGATLNPADILPFGLSGITQGTFEVLAAGKIHSSNAAAIDLWTITQNKVLRHRSVGY
jgi:type II secretory pathway pseudopilin PulG